MLSNKWIRTAKIGYIVTSVIFCLLGILLFTVPDFSLSLLCTVCGILLILFGIIKIIGYLSKDLYRLAFQYDLAGGILLVALGLLLLLRSDIMIPVISAVLGIYTLADALLKIQISIDARHFGIRQWWLILIIAILTGVVGFLLIFRPFESMQGILMLIGIALLTEGVLNLITILTVVKIINRRSPEIGDPDF